MNDRDNLKNITISKNSRRVVLCGSLSFYHMLIEVSNKLLGHHIYSIPPSPPETTNESLVSFSEQRRLEAYAHLKRIRDPRTQSILVVNPKKHGIDNYIGPSTFAEIAVAFAQSKPIYVLFDFPSIFESELSEWRATPLLGDIENYAAEIQDKLKLETSPQNELQF